MQRVSKEAVEGAINKIFCNRFDHADIPIYDLIFSLIEEFKPVELSQEQKNKLGEFIFFNLGVLQQLAQSEEERGDEYITNYDDYLKLKNEVASEPG